jgi:hypothetical protein
MKKLNMFSFLIVAIVMMVGLTNCKKDLNKTSVTPKYVGTVAGSFVAQDGNITFKSLTTSPVGVTRLWTMYRHDGNGFHMVDGSEFITGSIAYEFWHNPANNPISFSADQSVYSNLTPIEDLRLVTETKDANGNTAYMGVIDFNPATLGGQGFPLTVKGYRPGTVLVVNTDALTSLPGGMGLTITLKYDMQTIDLEATKFIGYGAEFDFSQFARGIPVPTTTVAGPGNFVVYDGLDKTILGAIQLKVVVDGNEAKAFLVNLPAIDFGKGMLVKLTTTKTGWYDSATIGIQDKDIQVETHEVAIN